jgi:nicotinamidase-related amidase
MDKTLLVNNTVAVAKLARAYDIPTVLTTITAATVGDIYPGVQAQFPDQPPSDHTDTNAWADDRFREAMVATGRRKLVMTCLWTEVGLAYTVLLARADGYEVYFVEGARERWLPVGAHPNPFTPVILWKPYPKRKSASKPSTPECSGWKMKF